MTDDKGDRLDPRFDPAFQRGYSGPVTSRTARRPAPSAPPRDDGRPVGQPPPAGSLPGPTGENRSPALSDEGTAEPIAIGRNPFLFALAGLSVALIAFGIFLFQWMRQSYLDIQNSADFDYFSMHASIYGAPLSIALGVATGIAVLFLFALNWSRSRR